LNLILRGTYSTKYPARALDLLSLMAALALGLMAAGCSSSNSAQQDTTQTSPDSASPQPAQSLSGGRTRNDRSSHIRNQQGFVTQEDTIEAEVVTRNHGVGHMKPPTKGTAKRKFYSVQVGAFRELSNANKAKKVAQERYKKTVYHFYEKGIKMYRVTVGDFAKLQDGLAFLKKIQHEHPQEYKNAWVAEMKR
jgi:cell division protein FtsN